MTESAETGAPPVERSAIKAFVMVSGGLDSTLVLKILKDQRLDVTGVHFYTGFCTVEKRRQIGGWRAEKGSIRNEALRAAADVGVPVELIDRAEAYRRMVTNPKHGYGANANPCIDCRILMLLETKRLMEERGGHFIATGEVLGQRPFSQHRRALTEIDKEADLQGLILRPLSAKLLPPTIPEERGWVTRDEMYDIGGRSRKPQMALAEAWGIKEYPQPAGGCCSLTDPNYGRKFHDLLTHRPTRELTADDVALLGLGRHIRLTDRVKVIVGRDADENRVLEIYRRGRWSFSPVGVVGPLTIAEGELDLDLRLRAAAITASYSDGRSFPTVTIAARFDNGPHETYDVTPASRHEMPALMV